MVLPPADGGIVGFVIFKAPITESVVRFFFEQEIEDLNV